MAFPYPTPTNGIGIAAKVIPDAMNVTLSLTGTNTHQITVTLKDAVGGTKTATGTFIYVSRSPAHASVSASGLITGLQKGGAVIEISYPTSDNTHGAHTDGTPLDKIFAEVNVLIGR